MRFASALAIAASRLSGCGASVGCSPGSSLVVQKSGCDGFMMSTRSASSADLNLTFGHDHLLLGRRDLGFGLDDVDRCDRPELDLLLVVPERRLRQLERLLRNLQLADGVHQVEVGVANDARGLRQRLTQLNVGDLLPLLAERDILPGAVEREIAQQAAACRTRPAPESSCGLNGLVGLLDVAREASIPKE